MILELIASEYCDTYLLVFERIEFSLKMRLSATAMIVPTFDIYEFDSPPIDLEWISCLFSSLDSFLICME